MLRHGLNPFRIDARRNAAPQTAGFDQFRDHRPFRWLLKQPGSREDGEAGVTCTGKLLFISILHADMRQQAGQQRNMNFTIFRRFTVHRNAQLFHHLPQLGVDVLPLAHPQVVEVIQLALTAELVRRQRFLLFAEIVPQINKGQEVRLFVMEALMFLIRRLLFVHRPLTRILNRERRGDNHRFTDAAVFLRFQHHTRQTRIDRQLAELTA